MNTSKTDKTISFDKFAERTNGFNQAIDISTNTKSPIKNFTVGSYKSVILELIK